jgi:hypothetical protein
MFQTSQFIYGTIAIIIAVLSSAPGAESALAMVILPNGCRPTLMASPGSPVV